ncbi:unnamed protein product, partial [Scytosiphon promiscuus]
RSCRWQQPQHEPRRWGGTAGGDGLGQPSHWARVRRNRGGDEAFHDEHAPARLESGPRQPVEGPRDALLGRVPTDGHGNTPQRRRRRRRSRQGFPTTNWGQQRSPDRAGSATAA